jgi:hypothetical protein
MTAAVAGSSASAAGLRLAAASFQAPIPAATALASRSLLLPRASAPAPVGARTGRADAQLQAPAEPLASADTQSANTVRMHVEAGLDGLRVWFGIDGDTAAVAARAQGLLAQLRRGLPGSQRLALVVCNGETLLAHPADASAAREPHFLPPEQEP